MGMDMKLQMKMSQQLVMTPQLVQAIKLLQLSRLELVDEIRRELDANPILGDETTDPQARESAKTEPKLRENELLPEERVGMTERAEATTNLADREADKRANEVDWEQLLENRQFMTVSSLRLNTDDLPGADQTMTRPTSIREHLTWQLQMSDLVPNERAFALHVIGNLDDRGFLNLESDEEGQAAITIEDLAREAGLDPEDAPDVLAMIQRFDPVGVAARDLKECLLIQAEVLGFDEVEKTIIREHLHNVEKRNFPAIAKALNIPLEEVYDAVQEIQKLESTPARNFSDVDDKQIMITPDVYVVKDADKWVVADNDKGLQRLYVNEHLARRMIADPKAKEFINEKLRSAQWLIRAIEQRRRTIIRVTECIVEKQKEFLEQGVAFLKPMILRDIAESVGMHESTISRVTSNKYVHTPQGLFELKYFFNSSISRVAEDDIASESVKQAIKKMIAAEDKSNPMSDQQLVKKLEERDGIKIARRTVAKYREMLGILSSAKRKKMF